MISISKYTLKAWLYISGYCRVSTAMVRFIFEDMNSFRQLWGQFKFTFDHNSSFYFRHGIPLVTTLLHTKNSYLQTLNWIASLSINPRVQNGGESARNTKEHKKCCSQLHRCTGKRLHISIFVHEPQWLDVLVSFRSRSVRPPRTTHGVPRQLWCQKLQTSLTTLQPSQKLCRYTRPKVSFKIVI